MSNVEMPLLEPTGKDIISGMKVFVVENSAAHRDTLGIPLFFSIYPN